MTLRELVNGEFGEGVIGCKEHDAFGHFFARHPNWADADLGELELEIDTLHNDLREEGERD